MTTFTPTRREPSAGPTGSSDRRVAAAEQLAGSPGPRRPRRSGATRRIDEFDPDRYRAFPPDELGDPGRRAGAGRRAARRRGRRRSGPRRRAQRPGGAPRARSRARGQGRRGLRPRHLRGRGRHVRGSAPAPTRRPTRSPCCTTRSWPAARSSTSPTAWSSTGRSWCCTGRRATAGASFPHTLVVAGASAEVAVVDRFASRRWRPPRRRRRWSSSSATPRTCATSRCRSTAPTRGRSRCSGRTSAATRRCGRRRSRSAATTPGCAARPGSTAAGAESDLLAVYFGDGDQMLDFRTLQDHVAAAHPEQPAVQGRGRGRGALGVLGPRAPPAGGAALRGVPDQPQPRADRRRGRGVDPQPRDRGQRRALLAREHRRSRRRRPALLPRHPRRSRPRRPSGSSCSASSTTCSTASAGALAERAAARGRRRARSSTGPVMAEVRVCSASTTWSPARRGASTSTATACASCASATTGT